MVYILPRLLSLITPKNTLEIPVFSRSISRKTTHYTHKVVLPSSECRTNGFYEWLINRMGNERNRLAKRRLMLVHANGLMGEVIAAAMSDREDMETVDEIDDLKRDARSPSRPLVCIVFGTARNLGAIRATLLECVESDPLVILVDHTSPYVTVFRSSTARLERHRMKLQELLHEVRTLLECPNGLSHGDRVGGTECVIHASRPKASINLV
jgi:hypothetical protein